MARGGKREGAGRKAQGITKKVSITLTEQEWEVIEKSGKTVAAFLKDLIQRNGLLNSKANHIEQYKQYLQTVTKEVVLEGVMKGTYRLRPYAVPYKLVYVSDLGGIVELGNLNQENPLYDVVLARVIRKHKTKWDELQEKAIQWRKEYQANNAR